MQVPSPKKYLLTFWVIYRRPPLCITFWHITPQFLSIILNFHKLFKILLPLILLANYQKDTYKYHSNKKCWHREKNVGFPCFTPRFKPLESCFPSFSSCGWPLCVFLQHLYKKNYHSNKENQDRLLGNVLKMSVMFNKFVWSDEE